MHNAAPTTAYQPFLSTRKFSLMISNSMEREMNVIQNRNKAMLNISP